MPHFPIQVFTDDHFITIEDEESFSSILKKYTYIQAAGGLVMNDQEELLMIFRRGKWDLPKGKVEEGEDIPVAALREVKEETGISATITGNLPISTFHIYDTYGTPMLKETFWFPMQSLPQQSLIPQNEEEISQALWIPSHEVADKLKDSYASLCYLWKLFYTKH
ncbi:MAG: NUDIX domain-containing protein [Bacteroidales bacterium]|nr:NUDIX domain-containing protein [Bacteroidales bacterium]